MQHIHWTITTTQAPKLKRRCPRCENETFKSSGLFRLNAQQSHIDVWLVYKCEACSYTYNLTVHERVSPKQLAATGLYGKYLANDAVLAAKTARDTTLLRRNRVEPLYEPGGWVLQGEDLQPGKAYEVTITSPTGAHIRTDALLAKKLACTRARVQKAMQQGDICAKGGGKAPKLLRGRQTLAIHLPGEE